MSVASIKITGNVTEALAALDRLGIRAEETGLKTEAAFGDKIEGKLAGVSGMFQKLGATVGGLGLPFAETFTKAGDKIADAETKGKKFSATMAEVGKVATVAGAAGLAVVAVESVKLAQTFQQSTASIAAHANIPVAAATKIGNAFLSTAGTTTFSAQQMAAAFAPVAGQLETLTGHTLTASDSLTFMRASMDAAEASGVPLASAAATVASAMQVYKLGVGQASTVSDVMWNTSRRLGVSVSDLGSSFQRLEPRIAGSGMTIQQTGAFMLELASTAGNGRQAMRLAGTAIQAMISPTAAAQKTLESMGVSLTDQNGKFVGMGAAVAELHTAFAKLPGSAAAVAAGEQLVGAQAEAARMKTEPQTAAVKAQEKALTAHIGVLKLQASQLSSNSAMQAIFGRNANLMASIVAGGVPAFDAATKAVGQQGTAQKAAATQAATLQGEMETAKATVEDLGVKFGLFLIPQLQELMKVVAKVVGWLDKHKDVAKALAIVIGGVVMLAIGAYIAGMLASAAATALVVAEVLLMLAPLILIGVGIYELATHWSQVWGAIKDATKAAWDWIKGIFDDGVKAVVGGVKAAWAWITGIFADGVNFVKTHWKDMVEVLLIVVTGGMATIPVLIYRYWGQITGFTSQLWHDVTGFFSRMWTDITGGVTTGIDDVVTFFEQLPGNILHALEGLASSMFNFGKNIMTSLLHGIGSMATNVAGSVDNTIKQGINSIPVVGSIASHIPFLAAGGIVSRPTLAMVGEAGPEMVIPLSAVGGAGNIAPLPTGSGPAGGGGGEVVLELDGNVLGRAIWPHVQTAALQTSGRNATRIGMS